MTTDALELASMMAVKVLAPLAIIVAGFSIIFRRRLRLAKGIGLMAVCLLIIPALLNPLSKLLADLLCSPVVVIAWLAVSGIAYLIREQQRTKSESELRGAERTPMVPQHLGEDAQR